MLSRHYHNSWPYSFKARRDVISVIKTITAWSLEVKHEYCKSYHVYWQQLEISYQIFFQDSVKVMEA
jgi:hypothetical protein